MKRKPQQPGLRRRHGQKGQSMELQGQATEAHAKDDEAYRGQAEANRQPERGQREHAAGQQQTGGPGSKDAGIASFLGSVEAKENCCVTRGRKEQASQTQPQNTAAARLKDNHTTRRQKKRHQRLTGVKEGEFPPQVQGPDGDAAPVNQEEKEGRHEQAQPGDCGVIGRRVLGAQIAVDQHPDRQVGGGGNQWPYAPFVITQGRALRDERHQQESREEGRQFAGAQ
jgi:hypothetical protein